MNGQAVAVAKKQYMPALQAFFVVICVFCMAIAGAIIANIYQNKNKATASTTEVERFISGEALVKDGVRFRIYTDRDHNLRTYTEKGDVRLLTRGER